MIEPIKKFEPKKLCLEPGRASEKLGLIEPSFWKHLAGESKLEPSPIVSTTSMCFAKWKICSFYKPSFDIISHKSFLVFFIFLVSYVVGTGTISHELCKYILGKLIWFMPEVGQTHLVFAWSQAQASKDIYAKVRFLMSSKSPWHLLGLDIK